MDLQNGFASAADEHGGLIYVAGGSGDDTFNSPVRSAFVYNVEEDKWDVLPDMNTYLEFFLGAFVDGKFYVMGNPSGPSFEIFDSYTRSWKTMENSFNNWRYFVTAFGRLHCLSVRGLIEYDYSQDNVNIVGTFPTEDWVLSIKFAGVVSNKIIVGKKDPIEGQDFYILAPPSETGGTLKLIGFERPSGLEGSTICAATLDL
ncbi:hypothetical protein SUGI_1137730 [Cryptomeria japonica]|uniref:uncharacterized protein LOC131860130 n=1 Tax=Cryptomeria japonica TaxID=3369 RepID=UPI002414B943|nr:uncharacterized protein LOC131860130 [Cryptomeria japonica]GLJ53360.1 hypothetical protein SUGI_1137730 [Cryptomeria japonica]